MSRNPYPPAPDTDIDEQLLRVFDATPVPMVLSRPDGSFEYVNPALLDLLGYSKDEIYQPEVIISHPGETERSREIRTRLTEDPFTPVKISKRYLHKNGQVIPCVLTIVAQADSSGGVLRFISQLVDQTDIIRSQENLRLAALVYENSSEAMLVTDADNRILDINPALTRITGYSLEEMLGKNPNILSSGRHDPMFYQEMWQSLKQTGSWDGEIWNKRKNGEAFAEWLTINTIYDENQQVYRRVALFADITRKKEAEALILQQANYDSLTGLPNSRLLMEQLKLEVRKAGDKQETGTLLYLDIDRFKEINESLGHECGDTLLKMIAQRLQQELRDADFIARFSADEFAIILNPIDSLQRIEDIIPRLLETLRAPFSVGVDEIYITASVGIALFPADSDNPARLLRHADQAMSAAKQQGRNRYHYFKPEMQQAAQARMQLISEMRQALAESQFELHYQPILDLQSGLITKAEALIRWRHPRRGLLAPNHFIPLAEETGLIRPLGEWIFSTAAGQLHQWQQAGLPALEVSINVSPLQLQEEGVSAHRWSAQLQGYNLQGAISLEITESLLLQNSETVSDTLEKLRQAQFSIAIDDFGTGYSSLSYLKQFNADLLKIDRSFVQNLCKGSEDLALCEAIIVMAHKLGISVVAEGIETEAQLRLIRQAGCDFGQGWLFAKAIPARDFADLLRQQQLNAPLVRPIPTD